MTPRSEKKERFCSPECKAEVELQKLRNERQANVLWLLFFLALIAAVLTSFLTEAFLRFG